jgi:hypothetical protein
MKVKELAALLSAKDQEAEVEYRRGDPRSFSASPLEPDMVNCPSSTVLGRTFVDSSRVILGEKW